MNEEEVEASGLQGIMEALQEKCRSPSEEVPADMLAVIALAEQSFDSEREMTKREQALAEVERKLQNESSACRLSIAPRQRRRKCVSVARHLKTPKIDLG